MPFDSITRRSSATSSILMILAEKNMNQTSFIVLIFILPMWMNFLLRTLAWQTLLEKNGVINSILNFLHLPEQSIINTPSAIVLGMVYNFLPFMVLPIYNVLSKIDKDVIHAARDLGANTAQTFFKIIMPLSIPGIISGITMVFVPSLTTFVISDLLGGSKILLIGNVIEQEFKQGSNWNVGSGLSLVLMLFIIASMALIAKYDKNDLAGEPVARGQMYTCVKQGAKYSFQPVVSGTVVGMYADEDHLFVVTGEGQYHRIAKDFSLNDFPFLSADELKDLNAEIAGDGTVTLDAVMKPGFPLRCFSP